MATELGKAYVQIIPSARGIKAKMEEILDKPLSDSGQNSGTTLGRKLISGAAKTLAGVSIGATVMKGIKAAMSEGSALQQSLGGVETLFKSSADKVKEYANQAYKTAGLSANEYMENVTGFSASLLQSMGGDTSKAADVANMAMIDMSDNANKMGTDMKSIQYAYQDFAKQNYTLLDNLKLGYGGTKDEMQRLLNDAQKVTGVKYDINNLSDVYKAIHVIQGELGITGTTSKEAATTVSGSFGQMASAGKNLLGKMALGEDIKVPLNNLLSTTSTFLFKNFLPMLGNVGKGILNVLKELPNAFQNLFKGMGLKIDLSFVNRIFDTAKRNLSIMFNSLKTAFNKIIETIKPSIEPFFEKLGKLWDALSPIVESLGSMMGPWIEILGAFVGGVLKGLIDTISSTIDILIPVFEFLQPVFKWISKAFIALAPILKVAAAAAGYIVAMFLPMSSVFGKVGSTMAKWFGPSFKVLWNTVKKIFKPVVEFFKIGLKNIQTAFNLTGTVLGKLVGFFSRHFETIKRIVDSFKNAFKVAFDFVKGVIDGFNKAVNKIKEVVGKVVDKAKEYLDKLKHIDLFSAGKAIMQSFSDGLHAIWKRIKRFIGKIAGYIKAHKGPIEYDRVLLVDEGAAIMLGFHQGIRDTFNDKVKPLINQMPQQIQDALGGSQLDLGIVANSTLDTNVLRAKFGAFNDSHDDEYFDYIRNLSERPIEVTLEIDKKEIARAIASQISEENNRVKITSNRMRGIRI